MRMINLGDRAVRQKLNSVLVVTEDDEGYPYALEGTMLEFLRDWKSDCMFCPSNDAPVFSVMFGGTQLNTTFKNFGDFMGTLEQINYYEPEL